MLVSKLAAFFTLATTLTAVFTLLFAPTLAAPLTGKPKYPMLDDMGYCLQCWRLCPAQNRDCTYPGCVIDGVSAAA